MAPVEHVRDQSLWNLSLLKSSDASKWHNAVMVVAMLSKYRCLLLSATAKRFIGSEHRRILSSTMARWATKCSLSSLTSQVKRVSIEGNIGKWLQTLKKLDIEVSHDTDQIEINIYFVFACQLWGSQPSLGFCRQLSRTGKLSLNPLVNGKQ